MSPDYSTYDLDTLRQARRSINAAAFPERASELDSRIAALEKAATPVPPAAPTGGDRTIRRIGLAFIVFGGIEMAYGLTIGSAPGAVKFEFMFLLIGLVIFFGNLQALSVVRWLACLGIAPALFGVYLVLGVVPLDLTLTQARLYPLDTFKAVLPALFMLAALAWLARALGSEATLAARAAAGRKRRDMRIPLVLGAMAALAFVVITVNMLGGERAARAKDAVEQKLGPGYRYFTDHINVQLGSEGTQVSARVTAWNDREVLHVPVEWRE